jgi:hypothetical protein
MFRQLCLSFYDNFSSRLNLDRLAACYTLATNYITRTEPYKKYYNDNDFGLIKTFLAKYGVAFYNFVVLDKLDLAFQIKECCDIILNNKIGNTNDDLETVVRKLGLKIYDIMYNSKNGCLYDIRTPYSFLTNLVGNDPTLASANLNEMLKKLSGNQQTIIENIKDKMEEDEQKNVQKAVSINTKNIVITTLENYIKSSLNVNDIVNINKLLLKLKDESPDDDYTPFNLTDYDGDINDVYTNFIVKAKNLGATPDELRKLQNNDKVEVLNIIQKLYLLADVLDTLSGLLEGSNTQMSEYYLNVCNIIKYIILKPYNDDYNPIVNIVKARIQDANLVLYTWITSTFNVGEEMKKLEQYSQNVIKTGKGGTVTYDSYEPGKKKRRFKRAGQKKQIFNVIKPEEKGQMDLEEKK